MKLRAGKFPLNHHNFHVGLVYLEPSPISYIHFFIASDEEEEEDSAISMTKG